MRMCFNKLLLELKEIERLAEVGEAVEKWFSDGYTMFSNGNEIYSVLDLLEWFEDLKEK